MITSLGRAARGSARSSRSSRAAILGLVNGLLVVGTRINGFIVTLAMTQILVGVQYALVGTDHPQPQRVAGGRARSAASETLGIPNIFILTLLVAVLVALFFSQSVTGRQLLASGGNASAAQLAGISIDRTLVVAHTLSGLLCGVAAFVSISIPARGQHLASAATGCCRASPPRSSAAWRSPAAPSRCSARSSPRWSVRLVDAASPIFKFDAEVVNFVVGAVVLGTVALGRLREVQAARHASSIRSKRAEAALAEVSR